MVAFLHHKLRPFAAKVAEVNYGREHCGAFDGFGVNEHHFQRKHADAPDVQARDVCFPTTFRWFSESLLSSKKMELIRIRLSLRTHHCCPRTYASSLPTVAKQYSHLTSLPAFQEVRDPIVHLLL